MKSSDFAIQRTCAAPIPGFSGARLNLTSETLWIICALPRKVSSGSPTFMPMCSQRNIAARPGLDEGHPNVFQFAIHHLAAQRLLYLRYCRVLTQIDFADGVSVTPRFKHVAD